MWHACEDETQELERCRCTSLITCPSPERQDIAGVISGQWYSDKLHRQVCYPSLYVCVKRRRRAVRQAQTQKHHSMMKHCTPSQSRHNITPSRSDHVSSSSSSSLSSSSLWPPPPAPFSLSISSLATLKTPWVCTPHTKHRLDFLYSFSAQPSQK